MKDISLMIYKWLVELISSRGFWESIIAATVGGLIAMWIAIKQVKSSEKQQEQQRKEIVKHEREMELIKIQLSECNKTFLPLRKLPNDLLVIQSKLKENVDYIKSRKEYDPEAIDNMQMLSDMTVNISGDLFYLESVMKICGFSENDINECRDLRRKIYEAFDCLQDNSFEKYTQIVLVIPPMIDAIYRKIIDKQEELITKLQRGI